MDNSNINGAATSNKIVGPAVDKRVNAGIVVRPLLHLLLRSFPPDLLCAAASPHQTRIDFAPFNPNRMDLVSPPELPLSLQCNCCHCCCPMLFTSSSLSVEDVPKFAHVSRSLCGPPQRAFPVSSSNLIISNKAPKKGLMQHQCVYCVRTEIPTDAAVVVLLLCTTRV